MRCSEPGHRVQVAIQRPRGPGRWAWVVRPTRASPNGQPCILDEVFVLAAKRAGPGSLRGRTKRVKAHGLARSAKAIWEPEKLAQDKTLASLLDEKKRERAVEL